MNKKLLPLLILLLHSSLISQTTGDDQLSPVVAEQQNPSWLLLEQGKILYQQRDYGEALRKFLLAKRSSPYAPEANYLISRIFDVDNHLRLAVTQLQEALDQKEFFYDENDIYKLYIVLANIYYRQQEFHQYEAALLKAIAIELPTTTKRFRKGRQIRSMLQTQGIDNILYYYDDIFSYIVPATNELALYYYQKAYYNDSLRLGLYSIISTFSQGIKYLQEQQYISRIPKDINDLYELDPEYIIDKLSTDLKSLGVDYQFRWNLSDLSLEEPETQLIQIIGKIQEIDPLYHFSLIGYYLNTLEQYPVTQELIYKNNLYRHLYFIGSALSIQGYMDGASDILNVLSYLPQAGEWQQRSISQLRQSFIDRQVPLGTYLLD